jgi:hypothetical protein
MKDNLYNVLTNNELRTRFKPKQEPKPRRFSEMGVLERQEKWENEREHKLASARKERKKKEVKGCSFRPKLTQYKP